MTERKSLLGKWKLVKNGSDYLPGLDALPDAPLVLKMLGHSDVEVFKVEKKAYLEVEEIQLTYVAKNVSLSKSYQLCSMNVEHAAANDIMLAMVKSVNEDFSEMTINRIGPKPGQHSCEHYKLDRATDEIRLKIEITAAEGTRFNLIKYLVRFDQQGHHTGTDPIFRLSAFTMGWSLFDIWPSTMLSNASISVVKAVKVKCQDAKNAGKVLETPWTGPAGGDAKVDFHSITRCMGAQANDGEEVFMFVIKVTVGESSWYVTHRYREFDALHRFLLSQNAFVAAFIDNDKTFPGKSIFHSPAMLEQRAKALNDFVSFYLTDARYCRQTSLDALCSFLQLPEHLYQVAKQKMTTAKEAEAEAARAEAKEAVMSDRARVVSDESPKVSVAAAFFPGVNEPIPPMPEAISQRRVSTNSGTGVSVSAKKGPALSSAQQRLSSAMGDKGMVVIKHGRQGAPKRRSLFLNPTGDQLIIQAEDHYKTVKLNGVTSVRLGSEVDPATPAAALEKAKAEGPDWIAKRRSQRRSSLAVLGGGADVLFGTATLRRSCEAKKMDKCVSLIMPTRTVDLECLTDEDLALLKDCLTDICAKLNAEG